MIQIHKQIPRGEKSKWDNKNKMTSIIIKHYTILMCDYYYHYYYCFHCYYLILPFKIMSPELQLIYRNFHLPFPVCDIKEIIGEGEGCIGKSQRIFRAMKKL